MIDEKLLKDAEKGDIEAQNNLGLVYLKDNDFKKALYWFTKAAEQGYDEAQENLSNMYFSGKHDAIKFSNNRDDKIGGHPLEDPYIYVADPEQGVFWAIKAAEQGNPKFQERLAWYYDKRDKVKSKYWYTKAAEQGYVKAQSYLGWIYYYDGKFGKEMPKDLIKGIYWATKAAEQGDSGSQNFLRKFYLEESKKNNQDHELSQRFKKAAELVKEENYEQAEKTWNKYELWRY